MQLRRSSTEAVRPRKTATAPGKAHGGKTQRVTDLYPLWDIVETVALTDDGWCEVGVRLELPSRLFLEEHALLTQHTAIKTLLQQGVPVGARLRVYLSVEPERQGALERAVAPKSRYPMIDRLHLASQEMLQAKLERGEVKRWNAFATLRVRPPLHFSKDAPPSTEELRRIVEHAHLAQATLITYLQNAGLNPAPMRLEEMTNLASSWWNPQRSNHPPVKSRAECTRLADLGADPGALSLRSQLLTTAIHNQHPEYLRLGTLSQQVLLSSASITKTPMPLEPGGVRRLCDALGDHLGTGRGFIVIEWTHLDPTRSLMALESAKDTLFSKTQGDKSAPNPQAAQKLKGIEKTLGHLTESGDHPFAAGVTVVFTARELREWRARRELVKAELAATFPGGNAVAHAFQSLPQFVALAPWNARVGEFNLHSDASFVSTLFPPIAPWAGHAKGVIPVRNRQNALTWLSLFEGGTNANHFAVLAPTGGGKTFAVMSLLSHLIAHHDPIVTIVDRKNDFQTFTAALGGANIPFYPGSGVRLNPMDLAAFEHKPDAAKMAFLIALLKAFIPFSTETTDARDEYSILLDAINQTYRRKAVAGETPVLSDLKRTLETSSTFSDSKAFSAAQLALANSMASGLRPFLGESPWGEILDRPTNIDLSARVTYFDLSGIQESDEQMRRIALLMVQDRIWTTAKNYPPDVPKLAFVDEFGSQIQTEDDRRFVSATLRMARSYGLSFGLATQTVHDLERISGIEEAISHFLIGKLMGGESVFRDRLKLPPAVIELICKLKRVSGRGGHQEWLWVTRPNDGETVGEIIKLEVPDLGHAAFSSAPDEKALRERMLEQYGSLETALDAMLTHWGVQS